MEPRGRELHPAKSRHSRPVAAAHSERLPGKLKIIAAILEQPVIEKFLAHLGLQGRAQPHSATRGLELQAA